MITNEQNMTSLNTPDLIRLCELREFQAAAQREHHPQAATHLLALLVENDLLEARYLWQRLSSPCQSDPLTQAAFALVKALYESEYPLFYNTAASTDWGPLSPLVAKAVDDTRRRVVKLIPEAFTCISIDNMRHVLGVDDETAKEFCKKHNWQIQDGFIMVQRKHEETTEDGYSQNYTELQRLTEQLVKLQTTS